jgi:hypothetical protein
MKINNLVWLVLGLLAGFAIAYFAFNSSKSVQTESESGISKDTVNKEMRMMSAAPTGPVTATLPIDTAVARTFVKEYITRNSAYTTGLLRANDSTSVAVRSWQIDLEQFYRYYDRQEVQAVNVYLAQKRGEDGYSNNIILVGLKDGGHGELEEYVGKKDDGTNAPVYVDYAIPCPDDCTGFAWSLSKVK